MKTKACSSLVTLVTTCNQGLAEWDNIFMDKAMAVAAANLLVHHATIFELNVESYRKRTAFNQMSQKEGN